MGPHETEELLYGKGRVSRTKTVTFKLGNIFTDPVSDRGLISKIHRELKKLDSREQNNPIKNGMQSETKSSQLRNL